MPSSLFSRLLALHIAPVPGEDFFTEVVGWLFENNSRLLFSWAKEFLHLDAPYYTASVSTQVTFEKIGEHQMDSRPDLMITLWEDEQTYDVIFIESKLGSFEGNEQLPRYAEHLATSFPKARKRILVYSTFYYDPKDKQRILNNIHDCDVGFQYLRWHEFYNFLGRQPADNLIAEVLHFMEEKGMAQITRITPSVLSSFSAFPDVYNFIQTVFEGDVIARFTEILGKPVSEGNRWWNVAKHRRYLLIARQSAHINVFMGFRMPDQDDAFPCILAVIEVDASSKRWNEICQIFRKIETDSQDQQVIWHAYSINQPKTWAGVSTITYFTEILLEPDHVAALKKRFLLFLSEIERLKTLYPDLWID